MEDPVAHLARCLVLGALLDEVQRRFGGYDLVAHWTQGESTMTSSSACDRVRGVRPAGPHLVVATNCNGGVKEVLAFSDVPDRRALWPLTART